MYGTLRIYDIENHINPLEVASTMTTRETSFLANNI
jgi:hypothetical protein